MDKRIHTAYTYTETVERYCPVIGANRPLCRSIKDGKTVYECMNRHKCEQNGGCRNSKMSPGI